MGFGFGRDNHLVSRMNVHVADIRNLPIVSDGSGWFQPFAIVRMALFRPFCRPRHKCKAWYFGGCPSLNVDVPLSDPGIRGGEENSRA